MLRDVDVVAVRLDFFDDIFVPLNLMFPNSFLYVFHLFTFSRRNDFFEPRSFGHPISSLFVCLAATDLIFSNAPEQVWTWLNEGDEYFYDKGEWVRFRVEDEHWNDVSPIAPSEREIGAVRERKSPYSITVSGTTQLYLQAGRD